MTQHTHIQTRLRSCSHSHALPLPPASSPPLPLSSPSLLSPLTSLPLHLSFSLFSFHIFASTLSRALVLPFVTVFFSLCKLLFYLSPCLCLFVCLYFCFIVAIPCYRKSTLPCFPFWASIPLYLVLFLSLDFFLVHTFPSSSSRPPSSLPLSVPPFPPLFFPHSPAPL